MARGPGWETIRHTPPSPPAIQPNAQCNARAGTPPYGETDVKLCAMPVQRSEEAGVHTATLGDAPPAHHAAAAAVPLDGSVRPWDAAAAAAATSLADSVAQRQRELPPGPLPHAAPADTAAAAAALGNTLQQPASVAAPAAPASIGSIGLGTPGTQSGVMLPAISVTLSRRAGLLIVGCLLLSIALVLRTRPIATTAAAYGLTGRTSPAASVGAGKRALELAASTAARVASGTGSSWHDSFATNGRRTALPAHASATSISHGAGRAALPASVPGSTFGGDVVSGAGTAQSLLRARGVRSGGVSSEDDADTGDSATAASLHAT